MTPTPHVKPITCDPKPESSVLIPNEIQVHRQIPLNNAKITEKTRVALHKLLKNLTP